MNDEFSVFDIFHIASSRGIDTWGPCLKFLEAVGIWTQHLILLQEEYLPTDLLPQTLPNTLVYLLLFLNPLLILPNVCDTDGRSKNELKPKEA